MPISFNFFSSYSMAILKSLIEAVQSVVPIKVTHPRLHRRVAATDSGGSTLFQRRLHLILYYNKAAGEDSGWLVAGRMKESLGRALAEEPLIAGRLRRREEGGGGLEIVSNDSGVRLIEARISKTVAEFIDLKGSEDAEAELVFWKDVDDQNPQFSALFHVQVTNFQCGGYSIGISCSLLLADPLAVTSFMRRWANIHNKIASESDVAKHPIFYLPNLKPNGSSLAKPFTSDEAKNYGKTMIFKATSENINPNDDQMHKELALQCIEEVERKLGVKAASKVTLLVKEDAEGVKVEEFAREGLFEKTSKYWGLNCGSWDDFGSSEVNFCEGNKPAAVSYWIDSAVSGEGLVMLIPSTDEGVSEINMIVTIPT